MKFLLFNQCKFLVAVVFVSERKNENKSIAVNLVANHKPLTYPDLNFSQNAQPALSTEKKSTFSCDLKA